MSGPLLLMGMPLAIAPVVYALNRRRPVALGLALATTCLLSLVVLRLPLGEPIFILDAPITLGRTMTVLGRAFTYSLDLRPALLYLYLAATLLFGASAATQTHRAFLPVGLASLGLLAAALFVQPFLFAAIFLELAAAAYVAILVDPAHPAPRGPVRFLVYKSLGMPFILVAGWLLEGSAVRPGDLSLAVRATLLLGLGFGVLLALIPFHSWIPQVAQDSPPFASAFVFVILQGSTLFLMLRFMNEFEWLRTSAAVHTGLRAAGVAMLAYGGVMGLFQHNFARLLGHSFIAHIGAMGLAVGAGTGSGVSIALVLAGVQAIGMTVWALGMSVLRLQGGGMGFEALRGAARQWPLAAAAMMVGGLSVAGFPLTLGFAGRWALMSELSGEAAWLALLPIGATGGLAVGYARGLAELIAPSGESGFRSREGEVARLLLPFGVLLVLGLGLFPQFIVPAMTRAVLSLGNLSG